MLREARANFLVWAIIAGCSGIGCVGTARLYWGYWLVLPSAKALVTPLAFVERFTTFSCCTSSDSKSGAAAVETGAKFPFYGAGDWPEGNFPKALLAAHMLPTSEDVVSGNLLEELRGTLDADGVLVDGDPGYPLAKKLWGHVAVGKGPDGRQMIASALWGGEVSNDLHPYYEVLFSRTPSGDLRVVRARRYWFDVAGLEGIAQWLGGIAGFVVGTIGSVVYLSRQRRHVA
jgi:hypothetical protein